ncbi:TerC family protein [Chitiniphilus eburneus]|uniref:TerC family protein n=1 Tax=Chitiniphilus eburneus TaxID=2571148 RepID=A0A4U0PK70_9NEIS|nr:TerC family protein [Chitiniphilus eburneus]
MEILSDPGIWISLVTLVLLEIVLGIDNLVFIAILADRLPNHQRDKARYIGLSLALLMRIAMLGTMSWLITLTRPLFAIGTAEFSGKDLLLLAGGLFLTFKATIELHERLEGTVHTGTGGKAQANFWLVIAQIVVLDAVFSIDSVITAVGMADYLGVMVAAVVIAMIVMMVSSRPLTLFVNAHPTVVILCLSFLLMIGFSLIADGFGFHIPKGYLYAAIGFSVLIEAFNQVSQRNLRLNEARQPLRERTAEAILRLMGSARRAEESDADNAHGAVSATEPRDVFARDERQMITGVLTLAERSVRRIMTPRSDISWLDSTTDSAMLKKQLLATPHSLFPLCHGSLDMVIGVVRAKELLVVIDQGADVEAFARRHPPLLVPDQIDNMQLLPRLREAKGSLILLIDEYGSVQGLVTPHDLLEAIAGDFPDADETPDILKDAEGWLVKGTTDLYQLEQAIEGLSITPEAVDFVSVGGLFMEKLGHLPVVGEAIQVGDCTFTVVKLDRQRVELARVTIAPPSSTAVEPPA